jgi:Ca2+-transporting ATPase
MLYYNSNVDDILAQLETSQAGLSDSDAAERLRAHGPNILRVSGVPLWRKIAEPFASVFMLVLFIAAIISAFQHELIDATIIIVIIAISALIYYVQQLSTARILKALRKHTLQKVSTLRDGVQIEIDSSFLVPGDIITLHEGDKVPADARLLEGSNIRVDEATLTGESNPVSKQTDELKGKKEIYEQSNILFQGTFIISGDIQAVVLTTGNETEFGQLASLATQTPSSSPVQIKIDKLLGQIIAVVGAVAVVAFALAIYRGTELAEAIRFVMAVSVSAVPESLPVAISVILVLGMRRIALRKALVRDIRAIETIGVITTIATDKTGTLTKNLLTVGRAWQAPHESTSIETALMHSINAQTGRKTHDPLDSAMLAYGEKKHAAKPREAFVESLPFDLTFAMSGNIWADEDAYELFVKGSPESILDRSELTKHEHEQASEAVHDLTSQGFRVIALASANLAKPIHTFDDLKSQKLHFIGLIAVSDIVRPEAHAAIATAKAAGVTVRMITGDHFETAFHIGQKLGIVKDRSEVFDSRKMQTLSDDEMAEYIDRIRVFSRVIPENKYRILELLKQKNITAMTGDGVNDVPALTNAHVGVAMGSGSEIAKDAGDIILLDNNFKSIIDAMHEGRTILANIRRMLFYLLSTNAGEAMTAIGALVIGLPIPLLPVQILFVNLVTDTLMVIPLGLEPGQKEIMKRRPKRPDAPILSTFMTGRIILVAFTMTIIALGLYLFYAKDYGENYARTIVFSAIVVMQWANALNARSDYQSLFTRLKTPNLPLSIGLFVAVILQIMALFGPLRSILHITSVSIGDLYITGLLAFFLPIIIVEIHKFIGRRFHHSHDLI